VSVALIESGATTSTGADGSFAFGGLPAGRYSLRLSFGDDVVTVSGVDVTEGATTILREAVEWEVRFAETMTVFSAARRTERIVEAPAAVTVIGGEEIERQAAHGQLPKLLEFTPGVDVTQSGVYDYNFNTRGFNSSLNRRVAFLIDGRDVSVPLLGAQEWAAVPFPLDDVAGLEFVRGPSAALYGPNASSGVINLITRAPALSPGGMARLAMGERGTVNADFRWAGGLGDGWHAKVSGGLRRTDDFSVSRNRDVEYSVPCEVPNQPDCLIPEVVPLARDTTEVRLGGVRFDKHLSNGSVLTAEGGFAQYAGLVFQAGLGRGQVLDTHRWWARLNYKTDRWNVLAYYQPRRLKRGLNLVPGDYFSVSSWNLHSEAQGHWRFFDGRARLVAGASYRREAVDSFDSEQGSETILRAPVATNMGALFSQIDWSVDEKLELVLAGRLDDSTLHDTQFSPKGAVVYRPTRNHTLRLTYNEAFQRPNYTEYFLRVDVAPPVDLGGLNAACVPFGVDCGFGLTPVLGLGNQDLELEQIRTWELGYGGILGRRAFLSVDYYRSVAENFITPLLPQVGTPLGRINPRFGPWQPPSGLPEPVTAEIRAQLPSLSNDLDRSTIIALASFTNFGKVDTQGLDVGLNYSFVDDWRLSLSYSWFDYQIEDPPPGLDSVLLPNSPRHKWSLGLAYVTNRLDAGAFVRWVDGFRWQASGYLGDVPSYSTVDLNANFGVDEHWTVGVTVANLLDNGHWETFGGHLLGRRALGSVRIRW
jgi:iron complex outermembrane receptor protein